MHAVSTTMPCGQTFSPSPVVPLIVPACRAAALVAFRSDPCVSSISLAILARSLSLARDHFSPCFAPLRSSTSFIDPCSSQRQQLRRPSPLSLSFLPSFPPPSLRSSHPTRDRRRASPLLSPLLLFAIYVRIAAVDRPPARPTDRPFPRPSNVGGNAPPRSHRRRRRRRRRRERATADTRPTDVTGWRWRWRRRLLSPVRVNCAQVGGRDPHMAQIYHFRSLEMGMRTTSEMLPRFSSSSWSHHEIVIEINK